ncbi:hypothetical protein HAP94_10005 [Acidithiobacillus ferrivorans]|nr:hypothetical protein [Acidithiobacillus ferrivorans]
MINTDLPKSTRGKLAYYIDEIERLRHEGFTYNEILLRIKDELGLPASMHTRSFIMGIRKAAENINSGAYVVEQRRLSTSAIATTIKDSAPAPAVQKKTVAEMVQAAKEGKLVTEKSKQSNVVDLT